jgi:hypothetical protein
MEENNPSTSASASTETVTPTAAQPTFKVWRPPRQGGPGSARMYSNLYLSSIFIFIHIIAQLPDSYFEPTTGEIVALHQSRVAARERLVDGPLQTSLMREREEKKKEAKYPTVCIFMRRQLCVADGWLA